MAWAVAMMKKPNHERHAGRDLYRIGLEFYLPSFRNEHRHKVLLIPGYIFFFVDERWHLALRVYDIRVLLCEEEPALIEDSYIQSIKSNEDEYGLVLLPPRFRNGQLLRVLRGKFADMFVTYEGTRTRKHVVVDVADVNIFGRKVAVDFEPSNLIAA
jgi:transcription antitermination factor NusG